MPGLNAGLIGMSFCMSIIAQVDCVELGSHHIPIVPRLVDPFNDEIILSDRLSYVFFDSLLHSFSLIGVILPKSPPVAPWRS